MKIKKFEDIVAWQKAQELALEVYSVFKSLKDYSFKDQICRATISISSCNEVKSMIYLATNLGYLSKQRSESLILKANEISKIIRGLIKSIK